MDYARYFQEHSEPLIPLPGGEEPVLKSFENIEAVVFDIYGTLIISAAGDISLAGEASPVSAMVAALGHAGISLDAEAGLVTYRQVIAEHQKLTLESGTEYPEVEIREVWKDVLSKLGKEGVSTATVEEVALIFECAANPVWPMPELKPVLEGLREKGLTLGIVSNAQFYTKYMFPAFLGNTLEELGFDKRLMVYSYELKEGKPSRRLYAELVNRGVTPARTLYIGNDMLKDVWPSSQEGFNTVLFAGDNRSLRWRKNDERLKDCQPDAVITSLSQIDSLLK